MKKALIFFASSLLCFDSFSQQAISLTQSSVANWQIATDTFKVLDAAVAYPNFTAATNATWDLTSVTYDTTTSMYYPHYPNTNSAFPNAQYYNAAHYPINPNLSYNSHVMMSIQNSGLMRIGEAIERQAIPLGSISGSATDSLVFLAQNITYSSPEPYVSYPCTMGTNWASNASFTTDFTLTVAAMSLNNTPCQRKTAFAETDSVIGWGKMRVKTPAGTASDYIDVLMLKRITTVTDSFYIGGAPAAPALLSAFGITQGMVSTSYEYNFLRAGEVNPLVFAEYLDNSFAVNKIKFVHVHADRLPAATGVNEITASDNAFSIYPNPVAGNILYVKLNDASIHQVQYTLSNINGQTVKSGTFSMNNHYGTIPTPDNAQGVYFLRLFTQDKSLGAQTVLIK
jgi:hypothetical protein